MLGIKHISSFDIISESKIPFLNYGRDFESI